MLVHLLELFQGTQKGSSIASLEKPSQLGEQERRVPTPPAEARHGLELSHDQATFHGNPETADGSDEDMTRQSSRKAPADPEFIDFLHIHDNQLRGPAYSALIRALLNPEALLSLRPKWQRARQFSRAHFSELLS